MRRHPWLTAIVLLALPALARCDIRALIVGIDHYPLPNGDSRDLKGTVDAANFEKMIRRHWSRERIEVCKLLDSKATKKAIEDRFENWLIHGPNRTSTLLFFYSGHGTTVPVDPTTGVRSALIPHGFRLTKDGTDFDPNSLVTGEFFVRQIAHMARAQLRNFTMIVDACASAAITRRPGVFPYPKSLGPKDLLQRAALARKAVDAKAIKTAKSKAPKVDPLFNYRAAIAAYVVISAAGEDEMAWEGPKGGNLTVALTASVDHYFKIHPNAGRPMTYLDLQDGLMAAMDSLPGGKSQHPYIKGRLDRPMLSIGSISSDPYYLVKVEQILHRGPVFRLAAGQLFGIKTGAVMAIYRPGTLRFDTIKPIAYARVTAVDLYDSTLHPVNFHGKPDSLQAARAQLAEGIPTAARWRMAASLQAPNPAIRLDVQAFAVKVQLDEVSWIDSRPLTQLSLPPKQGYALRVRALGMDGIPSRRRLYLAVLDCTPDGQVKVKWPSYGKSSVDTRIVADGVWWWLGSNDRFGDGGNISQTSAFYLTPDQGSGPEFVKVIGTDAYVDYTPMLVRQAADRKPGATVASRGWAQTAAKGPSTAPRNPRGKPDPRYSVTTLVVSLKSAATKAK